MGKILEKCDDIHLGLLAYKNRATAAGFSAAELMFGRSLRTNVPVLKLEPTAMECESCTFSSAGTSREGATNSSIQAERRMEFVYASRLRRAIKR
ncbi:hypothetical protein M514_03124, partial [Trichuris suis]